MSLSYRSIFLPITLILTLGISNCKTADPVSKPSLELPFIKNTPNAQTEAKPSIVVSKRSLARPKREPSFPKLSALKNLTGNQVYVLLGTPDFKRVDNPAEVWQYRNHSCTLDLFLYKNLDTLVRSIVHFEIRLRSNPVLTKSKCFEILINESAEIS